MSAIGGIGGGYYHAPVPVVSTPAAAAAPAPAPAADGGSVTGVMMDAVSLESEMALKLLKAGAQEQIAAQQMEFTQQMVDMYV